MSQVPLRALAVVAVLAAGPDVIAQQTPAPVPQVTVTGEVNHPGSIDWTAHMTVQAAINASGGVTDRAAPNYTLTHHSGAGAMSTFSSQYSRLVQPGDRLEINARLSPGGSRVFVGGAVRSPGHYTVPSGMHSVATAISAAGGLAPDAGADVQVWTRPGPIGVPGAPIDASTSPDDVIIFHVSRTALEGRGALTLLRDSGAVVVPRADARTIAGGTVTVTGDVKKPGPVSLERLTLRAALVAAGGLTSIQDRSFSISHASSPGPASMGGRETVGYQDIADGSLDLPLRDGDVVTTLSFVRGDFTAEMSGSRMRAVQWRVRPGLSGSDAKTTAQEALTRRNAQPMMGDGPPWAPLVLADMTVERLVGDRVVVLRPTPAFLLEPADAVTVIQRRWDVPTYPLRLDDLVGDWRIDASRDLRLDVQGGAVTGLMTDGATSVRLKGEALGNLLVLRLVNDGPKGPLSPHDALSAVSAAYFDPRGGLTGHTGTLHAGVEGLHYFTRDDWHAVYR